MVVHATQMSVGSPAGRVVTLMVSLSPIHRPVMALHMRPVYTVLLGHGQRGLLGGRVPVPVAPVHAQKSDLWRPIRLNDTEEDATDEEIGRDRGNTAAKKRSPYRRRSTGWGGEVAQGGRAARGQGEQTVLWRCLRAGPGP